MTVQAPDALRVAERVSVLSGEGALDVFNRARALEATGREVIHLELGQPDVPTPPHVVEAGVRALRDGDTRYSQPVGLPELRAAVAESLAAFGLPAQADNVVIAPGAKAMLFHAILATVEPGDEVLVPDPGFPTYPSAVRLAGGLPVSYGLDERADFSPDVDDLASRIGSKTRVLILNAPHNPTGGGADVATLERIAELAERHNLLVITDEIYSRLTYDGAERAPSIAQLPGLAERTFVIDGCSKTYAMTGWRLGYGLVPSWSVERLATLAVNAHTCTATFVQRAGIAALQGPQDGVRALRDEYQRRRDRVVRGLNEIPTISCATPRGAFYAFPNIGAVLAPHRTSASWFADRLLDEHGVAALAGDAFGAQGAGHLRLSFASSPASLDLALARIRACVDSLAASADAARRC